MPTLAQWNPNDQAPPPPLPAPPWVEATLFESPWTAVVGVLAVGLAAAWVVNRAGQGRRAVLVALVSASLAGGLVASASLVITDRETVIARTREAVAAVARGDADAAERILHPSVALTLPGNRTDLTKADIVERVRTDMNGRFAVRDRAARLSALRATLDGAGVARTQARIGAVHEATGFPATTWWIFGWRRGEDGVWRLSSLEMQQLDGAPSGMRYDP